MSQYGFLGGAIITEVIATLCLEPALTRPLLWPVVIAGYVCAFYFLSRTLKAGMGLGIAYGIWSAVGVALTAVLASVLFDDPLPFLGIAFIVAGVYLVQK